MKSTLRRSLLNYVQGEGRSRMPSDSALRRFWFPIIGTAAALSLAYVVGRSPPAKMQVQYHDERVEVPVVQGTGYDKDHFSRLEVSCKGSSNSVFYPSTAVKKWDGRQYLERSRQTQEMYAAHSLHEVMLSLYLPQEPQQVIIGGKDFSPFVRPIVDGYKVVVLVKDTLFASAKSEQGQLEQALEVLIYYHTPDSADVTKSGSKTPAKHLEDAESYVLRLVQL